MTERVAFVTGANTGVGFEVVRALARLGMTVYLGSRNEQKGIVAVEALDGEGDVRLAIIDLTDEQTIVSTIETIDEEHGRLDALVNNAAVAPEGNVLNVERAAALESFETNLHGPVRLTQLAVPLLRKSNRACIVNVSSGAGFASWLVDPGQGITKDQIPYAYCAAKAALNAATIMQAGILEPEGIKVNAASPGFVKSQLSGYRGTKTPAEGAKVIVQLATLDEDGPTGGFYNDQGLVPW